MNKKAAERAAFSLGKIEGGIVIMVRCLKSSFDGCRTRLK
jgi:hypothetical protein